MKNFNIPFKIYDNNGTIEITYKENKSISESGFDILEHIKDKFDISMCIGYPAIHAKIVDFDATGYKRYCGWIQILELDYYDEGDLINPVIKRFSIDKSPNMNLPFFSIGYPAELYDAPCNNIGGRFRLSWKARTYLVIPPENFNNNTISYLAGFKWGYDEEKNSNNITIHNIGEINREDWMKDVKILQEKFSMFTYK